MTKRKRNIFTVLEAVPNWFEAGEGSTATPEETDKGANWLPIRKDSTELVTGNTGQTGSDWALGLEGSIGHGAGEKGSGGADWASNLGGPTEQVDDEVSLRSAHVAPSWRLYQRTDTETGPRSEVQPQPSWMAELNEWLKAPRPPVNPISNESVPVVIEELDDFRSRALNAFWSLLKTAGYEEV